MTSLWLSPGLRMALMRSITRRLDLDEALAPIPRHESPIDIVAQC
jgi:hypothetical protein